MEKENKWFPPVIIVLGGSALLNLLFLLLVFYCSRQKKQNIRLQDPCTLGVNLRSFTYKELEEVTNGYNEELGKGAFSTVYKGKLKSDSRNFVAVKRLEKVVERNDKEFKSEVSAIGKTNHKNLVQLLGFCDEEAHQILVYEFMKNGSLESFLFESSRLSWFQRTQIALGIARGLEYLHEACEDPSLRPSMKKVIRMLEGDVEVLIPPDPYSFVSSIG
ncbi:hypothetical protein IFM89_030683 [Coptis chinensis]|uniref:non-specific serine/threonine protein kinase n=1 Tax=Coptis chinensis TaxID=261450 RepID=A0A835MB00_9MAGN|nr:hypothetical protein IFM89_030683 [Coptis chinensis]